MEKLNFEYKLNINNNDYNIVDDDVILTIKEKISDIYSIIKNNNNKELSDTDKDNLYKNAQDKWKELYKFINDISYTIYLKNVEVMNMLDIIMNRVEYDINNMFYIDEIKDVLNNIKVGANDDDIVTINVNVKQFMCFYNLIKEHKITGYTDELQHFINIVKTFNVILKLMNMFDTILKDMASDIHNWVSLMDSNNDSNTNNSSN